MKKAALTVLLTLASTLCFSFQPDTLSVSTEPVQKSAKYPNISYQKASRYAIPVALVGYGFTSLNKGMAWRTDKELNHELMEEIPGFATNFDDKLQYAPVAMVYTLEAIGIKGKNNLFDRTALYLISNSLMGLTVNFLKEHTSKLRPSGDDRRSFPSGHTATAFVAAEFMRQEFKDKSPVYGYVSYSLAGATGALRMMNNKHWFSDVLAGAGVGIASTKLTYLAYPWIKKKIIKKNLNIIAVPLIQKKITGFSAIAWL
ncbi:phosphatase PAP2 family protein [Daejeonella sp.]|uniref:phosphatase PAP2 family protein n=1 Tax=Daejeonella sp. TaxID=2805397 RepID=UPI0030BC92F3